MKQILLPVPLILLALSGCLRDPEIHAIQESSRDEDYHRRSDSAMALLDSMTKPKTVYVHSVETVTRVDRVEVPRIEKEIVYVEQEMLPRVSAMVRPVYIRDTVRVETVRTVERVTALEPKRSWSIFTIKKVVDTVYLRDTVVLLR